MCDFDDLWDDLELEDFAIIGGVAGYVEEQIEEDRIHDQIIDGLNTDHDGAP